MIKKLKNFYKNNRIYSILMIISLFCLILMASGVVIYFVNQTVSSPYGNRLDDIKNHNIDSSVEALKKYYKDSKGVTNSNVRVQGRIIYIDVEMEKTTSNETIQNLAVGCLEKIPDTEKTYYDIQFIFKREGLTPYLGSKSASNTVISWANYSVDTTTSTTTKKK